MQSYRKFFQKLGVKNKIITILLAVAYISILLVSAISYVGGRDLISNRISIEINLTAENTSQATNRLVYERFNDLQNLISNPVLSNPNSSIKSKTDELNNSLIKLGWYENLHLTNNQGVIIASTQKSALNKNLTQETWYQKTEDEFIAVSDLTISPLTEKEVLFFSNTITDENNNKLGIITAEFSWQVIQDVIEQSTDDVQVYIFSKEGKLLAKKKNTSFTGINSIDDLGNVEILKNYFTTQIDSKGYLGFDGNGWTFVVQIPKTIAFQPLTNFTNILILAVIGISLLVYIIGNQTALTLVKPIQKLTKGVRKFTKGNLEYIIDIPSEDEIGFLASNFNEMSQTLLEKTNFLREEKGKYKSILESTNEGIALVNLNKKIIANNEKLREILNLKEKNLANRKALELFEFMQFPENQTENKKQFATINQILDNKSKKQEYNFLLTLEMPKYKILNIFTAPVTTEDNQKPLGRIWIFQDVTKEKSADKLKSDFIKVISHKLRTPLTVIEWTTQLLSNSLIKQIDPEQKEAFEQISSNTERLNYLVNMLVNAAEIQKRVIKPSYNKFDILELIDKTSDKLMNLKNKKATNSIQISNSSKSKRVLVNADEHKIRQVLNILLENATTYIHDNKKNTVKVKITPNKKTKKVKIEIADRGLGIPKEEQGKVFTKFFRGEKSFTKHPDGAGLGLYLAKIIMDSHHEKITFTSNEEGTVFSITLKLA